MDLINNNDEKNQIPFVDPSLGKIASICLGVDKKTPLQSMLSNFGIRNHYTAGKDFDANAMISNLKKFETVIVSIHDMSIYQSKNFGISQSQFDLIYNLNSSKNIILIVNGSPYALKFFTMIPTIIETYEERLHKR